MASSFQKKIINKLKSKGWTTVSVAKLSGNGYPDILAMKNGMMLWIESKEPDDTLSPLQRVRIKQLRANGFRAYAIQKGKGIIY